MSIFTKTAVAALFAATTANAGEVVTYGTRDAQFEGYQEIVANPKGTVVVLPTWNGVSDYEKDRAQMLADMGYNALAADLHGKGALPKTMEEKEAAYGAFFKDETRMDTVLRAALAHAHTMGTEKIVVMGYSMGGGATMEVARSGLGAEMGVDAYVVFSGRVSDPKGRFFPEDSGPVFVAHGAKDHRVPVSGLINFEDDLDMAGVAHTIIVYPEAGHLFSAFGFPNYDAAADADSWQKLGIFLTEALSAPGTM